MRSIVDTLKTIRDITNAIPVKFDIVLVGGVAVILHGVERTTLDVDFCVYTDASGSPAGSSDFFNTVVKHLPSRFSARIVQGSKIPDDPLQHDIILLDDKEGEYERIDLLLARYKWEMEGIKQAVQLEGVPFPVLGKPYLVAMKLLATGYKDAHDIVSLFALMNDEEKAKTRELAKRAGRDKKLERLLAPPPEDSARERPEEYL